MRHRLRSSFLTAGILGSLLLAGCGITGRPAAATGQRPQHMSGQDVAATAGIDNQVFRYLLSLPQRQVQKAASQHSLMGLIMKRFPAIGPNRMIRSVSAVAFDGPRSIPLVLFTEMGRSLQDLLTYTGHGVRIQSAASVLDARLAPAEPPSGLVMGQVQGHPAFAVQTGKLDNRVTLALWNSGTGWHRVWSHTVTTTEFVSLTDVTEFVAGNTPPVTYRLVSKPALSYVPVAPFSSKPYWIVFPKSPRLGQALTITGWIRSQAGKTLTLNWTSPAGQATQWPLRIQQNGYFDVTEMVPLTIAGRAAPSGSYTLATVLDRQGDSMNVLKGDVVVRS